VQFGDENGPIGDPVDVDADGVAQIGLLEPVGNHNLYAYYAGDDFVTGSTGYASLDIYDPNPPTSTSDKLGTVTTLVSSKNPVAPGESYTVTASVAPAAASDAVLDGTVSFTVNFVAFGEPVPLDGSHSAAVTLTAPPSGVARQTVRARYNGNADYLPSNSASLFERIAVPRITTSTPPPPRDVAPPIFTVGLTPVRLGPALRRGIRAHVACNEGCSATLRLALTARRARALGIKVRSKSLVVGEGSYDFTDRQTSDIVIHFSKRYRKALAKARRAPLRLTSTVSDLVGNEAVHVQTVTLKR
jgi:hypothetical protein